MLCAILICSDPDCAQEFERFEHLGDFEKLACDCGCTLEAIAFSEAEPVEIAPGAQRLGLRQAELRQAA